MLGSRSAPAVIEQRVRNRQIEWLEATVSANPLPFGLNELVNQWFDWNPDVPDAVAYPAPTYTPREASQLIAVGQAVNRFCDATPGAIDDDAAARALPEWAEVLAEARQALVEMSLRDRLSEDD